MLNEFILNKFQINPVALFTNARSQSGNCKIQFAIGVTLDAHFELQLRGDGHGEATCPFDIFSTNGKIIINREAEGPLEASLSGVSEDGGKISIERLILIEINLQVKHGVQTSSLRFVLFSKATVDYMPITDVDNLTVVLGLLNFVFRGCEWSKYETRKSLDKFTVQIGQASLTFKQADNYEEVVESLKKEKGVALTATLTYGVRSSELEYHHKIVEDTLMLLSYATGNYVSWLSEDVFANGKPAKTTLNPAKAFPYTHGDWVIDADNISSCFLKDFLLSTIAQYQVLKDRLGFNFAIEYYLAAKNAKYLEIHYLLLCTTLECIGSYVPEYLERLGKALQTHSVEATEKKIRQIVTHYMKTFDDELVKALANQLAYPGIGLRDKLRSLMEEFRMKIDEKELVFTRLRALLVHQGRFPRGVDPALEVRKLTNLIDRIMLNALGYKGVYLDASDGFRPKALA